MPRDLLNRTHDVHGPFTLKSGRLTFKTGDPALLQRLATERDRGEFSTLNLLAADPFREFTGQLESAKLTRVERPQEWEVIMTERSGKPRKRG
jgi:hypothetical protein